MLTADPTTTLTIGGDLPVHRLGFGAMRLAPEPDLRAASIATARRVVELGVTFLDTADSYDLGQNEELLAEALHPYRAGVVVATKAGQAHPGHEWIPLGRPEYLRQQCELSLRRLGVEAIDLFQLHRVDPTVPADDQFGALAELRAEGKVRFVGLSEVGVAEIERAQRVVDVATVQNRYNLVDRASDAILRYCTEQGIGFLAWSPVASGELSQPGGPVAELVDRLGATSAQVALAWLLQRSSVMLPIPGTSSLAHLEENCLAAGLKLDLEAVEKLDAA